MPKEAAEQTFTMMSMKSATQGVSTILVAALDPKLAGMIFPPVCYALMSDTS